MEKKFATLISLDSKKLNTSCNACKHSKILRKTIIDFPEQEIPVNVNSNILEYVIQYLKHYEKQKPKKIRYPLLDKDFKECVDEWDYNFINLNIETIFKIMEAANYLDIPWLMDLTAAKIASMIRGKNSKEIREILKIKNESNKDEEIENKIEEDNSDNNI